MARRQPVVVVGGGLVLGLLVGRLLRSGASEMQSSQGGDWRGSTYGATGYAGGTESGYKSQSGYDTQYGSRDAGYGTGAGSVGGAAMYGDQGGTSLGTASTATPLAGDMVDEEVDLVDVDAESETTAGTMTRRGR
jgi:hypothetical protein